MRCDVRIQTRNWIHRVMAGVLGTRTFALATGSHLRTKRWSPQTGLDWGGFVEWLDLENPAGERDCGGYFAGELSGPRKTAENVVSRSMMTLDADKIPRGGGAGFLADVRLELGVAGVYHTTWSHRTWGEGPGGPVDLGDRYRVVLPLDRDVDGEEYWRIAEALMTVLGRDWFDPTCSQPSRMMHRPSAQGDGADYDAGVWPGDALNADEWLRAAERLGIGERHSRSGGGGGADYDPGTPPTPRQVDKAVTILKKNAREVEALRDETRGEDLAGRNVALIKYLPTLYRFVLGGCLDRDEVDQVMGEAVEQAPGPDAWTEAEWARVSENAWAMAEADEGARPEVEEPAEDFGGVIVGRVVPGGSGGGSGVGGDPWIDVGSAFTYGPARVTRKGGAVDPEAMARAIDAVVPIGVDALDRRLLVYNGGVWADGEDAVSAAVAVVLGEAWKPEKRNTVKEYLRDVPWVPRIAREPVVGSDGKVEHLNFLNGMLRWRDGVLERHDPALRSVVQLPWEWDPDAECPEFDRFLSEVLPADAVELAWQWVGYMLYPGNPNQTAGLCYGPKGRNGKGTLQRVIQTALGKQNYSSVSLHELTDDTFAKAELYGRMANIAGDLESRWLKNTALVKGISGDDSMSAHRKNGHRFDFTTWATLMFSTNDLFGSDDTSESWFNRWVVLSFPRSFLGVEDTGLTARLTAPEEIRGVIRKAVETLPGVIDGAGFAEPESSAEVKREMMYAGDSIREWVDEHCELGEEYRTPQPEIWAAYQMSGGGLGRNKLYRRLEQIAGVDRGMVKGVRYVKGLRVR